MGNDNCKPIGDPCTIYADCCNPGTCRNGVCVPLGRQKLSCPARLSPTPTRFPTFPPQDLNRVSCRQNHVYVMSYIHSKMFRSHLLLGIRIIVIIHRDCRLSQPQSGRV
jgi:hypothetical protein